MARQFLVSKRISAFKRTKDKKLFLKFEAAMNIAEVWINGKKLAEHYGGYLPFVIDFTDVAKFDQTNTFTIKLNNEDSSITGPKPLEKLDFNTYGGLYRNVWLMTKNKLHITDPIFADKPASGGIFVRYSDVSDESANLNIQTHVKMKMKEKSFIIRHSLMYKDSLVASTESQSNSLQPEKDKEIQS